MVGDFDLDGKADVGVARESDHTLRVSLNDGTGFQTPIVSGNGISCTQHCVLGDIDGQNGPDVIEFSNDRAWMYISQGGGSFSAKTSASADDMCVVFDAACLIGDVNDDGAADAVFVQLDGDVYVSLSNGSDFDTAQPWGNIKPTGLDLCTSEGTCRLADVDNDGRADLVAFTQSVFHDVYVSLSTGTMFKTATLKHANFGKNGETLEVADVNGDGLPDLIRFEASAPYDVYVALSDNGTYLPNPPALWGAGLSGPTAIFRVGDYDGDHLADLFSFER